MPELLPGARRLPEEMLVVSGYQIIPERAHELVTQALVQATRRRIERGHAKKHVGALPFDFRLL